MKSLKPILLALFFSFGLAACNNAGEPETIDTAEPEQGQDQGDQQGYDDEDTAGME